jgi:hypothetical protein
LAKHSTALTVHRVVDQMTVSGILGDETNPQSDGTMYARLWKHANVSQGVARHKR